MTDERATFCMRSNVSFPVRVSVLIPAYNAAAYMERAIRSALCQTMPDLEVIVVDDASSDATAAIATRLAEQDRRIRLVHLPVNRGPAAARNVALAQARGDWVALLDADNSFARQRLATLLSLGEAHRAEMVSDNVLLCPEDECTPPAPLIAQSSLSAPRHLPADEFVARNIGPRHNPRLTYGFMAPIFRRAFLERHHLRYDERNRFGEDFMFYVSCLLRGARWWVTPKAMYHYTVRRGSLTEVQTAEDLQRIRTFEHELLEKDPRVRAEPSLARAIRRHKSVIDRCYYYRAFTDALKAQRIGQARRVLFENPSGFRHIVQESLVQTPVIAAKAWRGGYRRRAAPAA